ncbi:hypothetical protein LDENG_00100450 [Lucifuga dentata]|nr:hypothetical protein LDENG_00100450 [Lucifuga dentata]
MNEDQTLKTGESEWTRQDLLKLVQNMKASIPERDRMTVYMKGQKSLDWNKVAFFPRSSQACQQKWKEIMQKLRKFRTLTELIVEAESALDDPSQKEKIHPEFPKRPYPPNSIFCKENWDKFHKQHPDLNLPKLTSLMNKEFKALPNKKKAMYVKKFQRLNEEYNKKLLLFRKKYHKDYKEKKSMTASSDKLEHDSEDDDDDDDDDEDEKMEKSLQFPERSPPPKPPVNRFVVFYKEQLASMEGSTAHDLYERWRQLTEKEKEQYKTRWEQLKTEYAVKLNEYLCDFDEEEQQRILKMYGIKKPKQGKKRQRKERREKEKPLGKFPGEPKMPHQSAQREFFKQEMQLQKDQISNPRTRLSVVRKMWTHQTQQEKQNYMEIANNNIRKYSLELQEWFKTLTAEEQLDYWMWNPSKRQFLDKELNSSTEEELSLPSDSEDEDIEYSSSDEDEAYFNNETEEEEEGEIMFRV